VDPVISSPSATASIGPHADAPPSVSAADVEEAVDRVVPVARRTPLERDDRLSRRAGTNVWLKREDLQVVRSYKIRGAYNLVAQLDADERARGVACASAGNHGQGVALACRRLGVPGRIFVPRTTPRQKRERIAAFGGDQVDLVIEGADYDEAGRAAMAYAASVGATLVPPFDDPRTIAGQGTVIVEVVDQLGAAPDVVVVPVGGGGLIAGIATWLRERHPSTRIVGVEPSGAASMMAALAAGAPVVLDEMDAFVDGAAVRRVGDVTFPLVRDLVDEVVAVPEGRVCSEMLDLYQTDGIVAEPAGALAAAALGHVIEVTGTATAVAIVSGGNNDISRYGEIIERSLIHEGLKHYFLVDFPQEPGALRGFLDDVLGPDDDITLFEYVKRSNRETGPALVGIELGRPEDLPGLLLRLEAAPPQVSRVPADSPLFRFLL
jgi:threonine dehydratase